MVEEARAKILMIGKMGVGKSTLTNAIVGDANAAATGGGGESVTKKINVLAS